MASIPYRKFFMEACRTSIMYQKRELRAKAGIPGGEVHHIGKQFQEIVSDFIAEYGIDIRRVETRRIHHGWQFIDSSYANKFAAYHAKHAKMVIMTHEQHRQLHKEEMQ